MSSKFGGIPIDSGSKFGGVPVSTMGISSGSPFKQTDTGEKTPRQMAMAELAAEYNPVEAGAIATGKGFYNVGRGLGLLDKADDVENEAMNALGERHPISTTVGEAVGESAPFMIPGTQIGKIASLPVRALASGVLGATEGATLMNARGGDIAQGAGIGGAIGFTAEMVLPLVGKLGGKIVRRITGKQPRGAMLTSSGTPTRELQNALDSAGVAFSDLSDDAVEILSKQKPGTSASQAARKAMFDAEDIPISQGELTGNFKQLATEQRLLDSAEDSGAEAFRNFKLNQSEKVKASLRKNFAVDVNDEGTGQLIQDALSGRKKLLRAQKNRLYKRAADNAEDAGGIPVIADNIVDALPDKAKLRRLERLQPNQAGAVSDLMVEFGLDTNDDAVKAFLKSGGEVTPLSVGNAEDFRVAINAIERSDQTGTTSVLVGPLREAFDTEMDGLYDVLKKSGYGKDIIEPLKQARGTVRTLKTEFSPQSIVGRIVDTKKDGVTQITEASKVYRKLVTPSSPVEDTRRVVGSLLKSDKGMQAVSSLQASVLMDLLESGFSTESRKVAGKNLFNPISFRRKLDSIGADKLKAIFSNNKGALSRINNIEKIAKDLIPPAGTQPKGSASVILDLMNTLGLAGISTKIPGGAAIVGGMRKLAEPVKTRATARTAMTPHADVEDLRRMLTTSYPSMASALGIALVASEDKQ